MRTPLNELVKEVSAVLYTGHPLIDGVRPLVPNFQHIGLIHCRPAKPLPTEFDEFMQKSMEHGVILVSFGTFAGGDGIPESVRLSMVDAFSKLEQNIIWKWDGSDMKDLPPNVMLTKWVPQQDILAHPATKLFISHVGQSSVQESFYHGVPVVCIFAFYCINISWQVNWHESNFKFSGCHSTCL